MRKMSHQSELRYIPASLNAFLNAYDIFAFFFSILFLFQFRIVNKHLHSLILYDELYFFTK